MINLIEEALLMNNDRFNVESNNKDGVSFSKDALTLKVYDNANLMGFTLSGDNIYIVHDTDNYDKSNSKYFDIYRDAHEDTLHVANMFFENKISVKKIKTRRMFKEIEQSYVLIPNKEGRVISYRSPAVNTTNFFD